MMKRILLLLLLFSVSGVTLSAKKVKFSVNMELYPVDTNGVHITGDFQDEAGFPLDWDPGTTAMIQDQSDTNIYFVVVDVPAFACYQYKFVNGIHGYQQEFVPYESRVNYNFLDSRWIYVDSLSSDTLDIGAIRYSGNAPAGKNLVRFYVDMQLQSVSSAGVHVMGNFQGWNPSATRMYSFDNIVYEYITYTDSNQITEREYLFVNGNVVADQELLAGWCKNANGYRGVVAPRDTMLPVICYSFCDLCSTAGLADFSSQQILVYPNPGSDLLNLSSGTEAIGRILITDILGNEVYNNVVAESSIMSIDVSVFSSGTYFVQTQDRSGRVSVIKWVKK